MSLSMFEGMCLCSLIIQLQAQLWDYRHQVKVRAEQVVLERFKKLHGDDMQSWETQMEFGSMWCDTTGKDYKFIWQGYDKTLVSYADCIFLLSYVKVQGPLRVRRAQGDFRGE